MLCKICGSRCEDGQRFCSSCGTPLEKADAAAEPVTEAAAGAAGEPVETFGPAFDGTPEAAVETADNASAFDLTLMPAVQPLSDAPQDQYTEALPAPLYNKCGVGSWIRRVVISFLPVLLTYLALFVSGIIWPGSLLPSNRSGIADFSSDAKTVATVILIAIGLSVLVQIVCLAVWAVRKNGDPALRDWAVGFIIVALAVIVAALLFSLGMMLFNDNYPRLFSFLEAYVAPVRYIGILISVL